ncbi:MAG TPA: molybdate ABC transporter substrate-binding protein [Solirubrobacteraceae bacterium]|jgi:molybdate transport system substrate-binding protein
MSRSWIAATLGALALAGCASSTTSNTSGGTSAGKPNLTVSAASSLRSAFTTYAQQFSQASLRYSFAGSDILAAQIEQGIKPDIFASANTKYPDQLYAKGLVAKPVVFAANKLVIAVPANSTKIRAVSDLEKPGVTIAIGAAAVPIGSYTREVLARLGATASHRILGNVRSEEAEVTGIVGKLTQGAVDAGFTYVTDVRATNGILKAIPLPALLQPAVAYGIAVVKGSKHQARAQAFISGLLSGAGQADLLKAGFLPAPAG